MPDYYFPLIIIEITAIIIAVIFYILEHQKDKRFHDHQELSLIEETRQKNAKILEDAIKKAQAILSEAEIKSAKVISDSKHSSDKIQEQLEKDLNEFKKTVQQTYATETSKVIADYTSYMNELQQQSQNSQAQIEEATKQKVNEFIETFEQNLSDFLVQTQQKSLAAIDLELASARSLIDTYKDQQFKIIDENILAMLERTLGLVLAKRLSLKEHMDLIYQSLEKAKAEKLVM